MKYWTEGNQIVLITTDNLLFGDFSQKEIQELTHQLDKGVIPDRLTGIPLNYIKDIQLDDRKKRIDIKLGKGSIEKIDFKSKQLRNTVFDYIKDNFKIFGLTRPSSSRIWKRYGVTLLFIAFAVYLLLTLRQFNGYSPGAKAISIFFKWLSETFDKTTIILMGLSLTIWRTIVLVLDIKALTNTLRLSRK